MKGEDISERLLELGARIIKMTDTLPSSAAGKHICLQVIRSGTSAGANYEEARGAESHKDFTHKLAICLKELRETHYWLRLIVAAELVTSERMKGLTKEADELCKIVGKSIVTLRGVGNEPKA